jgi:hypothetical protein
MSRTEQHLQRQTPILDSIKSSVAKITQGGVSSDLTSVQQVGIFGSDGSDWKACAVNSSGHLQVDIDVDSEGLATKAKQDDMITKLTDIELNTQPKTPQLNRTEAIPVQIMVGSAGSQYDALRANGQDLMVMIDDMNPDVAVNSGLSTSALQTSGNTSLASIDGKVVLPSSLTSGGSLKTAILEDDSKTFSTSTLMSSVAIASSGNANSSTLDLGATNPPDDVMFFIQNSASQSATFNLQVSPDNSTFYTFQPTASPSSSRATFYFSSRQHANVIPVRYMRLNIANGGASSSNFTVVAGHYSD